MLDFSSAFDTIDHTILVHRLHTDFGFTDSVLQWFSSYLTDRIHYVSLSNHCSAFAPVHTGFPQGSFLGPMLLTMYIKPLSATIANAQIPFKQSVKNLGFTLDCHLTMNARVSNIARTCYFELRRLASIRRFLTSTATATLVSAFVLSRIDYCNSLLFGSTNDVTSHLQRIQNYAA